MATTLTERFPCRRNGWYHLDGRRYVSVTTVTVVKSACTTLAEKKPDTAKNRGKPETGATRDYVENLRLDKARASLALRGVTP